MKSRNVFLSFIGLLFCTIFGTNSAMAQIGPVVSVSETQQSLPEAVQTFISTYFPMAAVVKAEFEIQENKYEVKLDNGYELDIRPNGEWLKVDAPNSSVIPVVILTKLLSDKIIDHLKKKNVLSNVEEISYYPVKGYYEVDIFNGKDLWFDNHGNKIREPKDEH